MATTTLFGFIDSSPFWSAFFAQLLATLIVVIIGSIIVPPILTWFARTKMIFYKNHTRRETKFYFSESKDGEYESTLHLSVGNLGKKTVERFYWEMYTDKDLDVNLVTKPPYPHYFTTHQEERGKMLRLYGYIEMPIFPLDNIDFVFEMKFKVKKRRKIDIHYYFRSDNGDSPAWAWIALGFKKYSWLKTLTIE